MNGIIRVAVTCQHCGKEKEFSMTVSQYRRFMEENEPIQSVFPELSPEDREMLISCTCGDCWEKLFPKDMQYE